MSWPLEVVFTQLWMTMVRYDKKWISSIDYALSIDFDISSLHRIGCSNRVNKSRLMVRQASQINNISYSLILGRIASQIARYQEGIRPTDWLVAISSVFSNARTSETFGNRESDRMRMNYPRSALYLKQVLDTGAASSSSQEGRLSQKFHFGIYALF